MNKQWIVFHLNEALKEIKNSLQDIQTEPDYDYGEYLVAMTHTYHHMNTAWNSRNISDQEARGQSVDDFTKWRQFPNDIDMSC